MRTGARRWIMSSAQLERQLSRSLGLAASDGFGARRAVPADKSECRLWVQKGDDRRNAPQRARRADGLVWGLLVSSGFFRSVPAVATRRGDRLELLEIELGNCLKLVG